MRTLTRSLQVENGWMSFEEEKKYKQYIGDEDIDGFVFEMASGVNAVTDELLSEAREKFREGLRYSRIKIEVKLTLEVVD